jgi:hypothetical protein
VIALLARFGDGDAAHGQLQLMTRRFLADNLLGLDPLTAGEVFQVDGSFGVTAAITEMLLASHRDRIDVLPALPAAWPDGSVTGLRTRHRVDVDIRWDDGAVSELVLTARDDGAVTVTFPRPPAPPPGSARQRLGMILSLPRGHPCRFVREAGTGFLGPGPGRTPRSAVIRDLDHATLGMTMQPLGPHASADGISTGTASSVTRSLAEMLHQRGIERVYSAGYPTVGVISVTPDLTVWTDGRTLRWYCDGTPGNCPAADLEAAAERLATLADPSPDRSEARAISPPLLPPAAGARRPAAGRVSTGHNQPDLSHFLGA